MSTAADQSAPLRPLMPRSPLLRHPGFQMYFIATALAMLADNIEHVISYWVIFQKFHSPSLAGFAVISHWLPFLAFSVYSGALADRFDPRRIIQLGMLLFMGVSISWGVLFLTGALQPWHARMLLIIHGCAGVLCGVRRVSYCCTTLLGRRSCRAPCAWGPLRVTWGCYVGRRSVARCCSRLGPSHAIFVNALIFLPMLLWLWRAPYGPRFRKEGVAPHPAVRGFAEVWATFRVIRENPTVLCMTLLAGGTAFFVGNAYQAQMPGFAQDLGHGDPGLSYSALLAADAFGALAAGFVLELGGLLRPASRTALALAMGWCCALGVFALVSELRVWHSCCCSSRASSSCRSTPWRKPWCS